MPGNTDLRYHISRLNQNPQHISCRVVELQDRVLCKSSAHKEALSNEVSPLRPIQSLFLFISSPEPSGSQKELIIHPFYGVLRGCYCCRCQQCPNVFSSETARPFKAKLYVGRWNENLYRLSMSHDQDRDHSRKCSKP